MPQSVGVMGYRLQGSTKDAVTVNSEEVQEGRSGFSIRSDSK